MSATRTPELTVLEGGASADAASEPAQPIGGEQPPSEIVDSEVVSPKPSSGTPKASEKLVALVSSVAELCHDDSSDAFALIQEGGRRKTLRLRSTDFDRWLSGAYYRTFGSPAPSQARADAMNVLQAQALFDGPRRQVYVRVAGAEGALFLDLGNDAWEAIEITSNGWRVVAEPPVLFERRRGQLELPTPVRGGSADELLRFANLPCAFRKFCGLDSGNSATPNVVLNIDS